MKGDRSLDGKTYGDKDNSPTPLRIKEILNKEFNFDSDPCTINPDGLREFDGFGGRWGERVYVNPPWSKTAKWVKEAIRQYKENRLNRPFITCEHIYAMVLRLNNTQRKRGSDCKGKDSTNIVNYNSTQSSEQSKLPKVLNLEHRIGIVVRSPTKWIKVK